MEQEYSFFYLDKAIFASYSSRETQEKLRKWGFIPHMSLHKFRFDQPFNDFNPLPFLLSLVNSQHVCSLFHPFASGKKVSSVEELSFTEIKAQETSMDYFNFLTEKGLVYENGSIKKVIPDYFENIEICDKIREVLLVEESEDYGMIDDCYKKEFLFKIFEHIAIGGGVCQYEDVIGEYLDVVKGLYKDFISVTKDNESQELKVNSKVFKIGNSGQFDMFRNTHIQDFCYVIVDPGYRHVNIWYHKWEGMW